MGIKEKFFNNTRKPQGIFGKMMVKRMNKDHVEVSIWGISLAEGSFSDIGDFGCGGGRTTDRLLKKFPDAKVTGLDYSEISVAEAREFNKENIKKGRCRILKGDVSSLPFEDESFDLITAFETVYFWPGPAESFKEVRRVLRTGGTFQIVNNSDGLNPEDEKWESIIDNLKFYKEEELTEFLKDAGFEKISVIRDEKSHRLCIKAVKTA